MISSLFLQILNMSLTGALMILAVLMLRLLLKRVPRIFSYGLWAVVLFRLLCPISFESGFSLLGVLHAPTAETGVVKYISDTAGNVETFGTAQTQMGQDGIMSDFEAGQNTVMPKQETGVGKGSFSMESLSMETLHALLPAMAMVWLAGVFMMLLYGMFSYGRLSFRLRTAKENGVNGDAAEDKTGGRMAYIRVRYTDIVSTPFVLGILKPCIYLPDDLPEKNLEYILLHERIHIRRGDHLTRVAAYLALCLHWFNPLVWLAFFISGRDMEMSCDEAVIRKIGNRVKKEYSTSLLSLAYGQRITAGIPLAFGEADPKSRIKNVLRYKKPAFLLVLIALLVCVLAAVFLLGNPRKIVQDQLFYGVVMESEEFGGNVVLVPQLGEMRIPEAEKVSPYIEIDFNGLEPGHLVRITFSGEEEVGILETYPGQFSRAADSIEVMGVGFVMQTMPDGKYRFGVPLGMAEETEAGDTLRIYHSVLEDGANLQENYHMYLLDSPDKIQKELVAEAKVSEVDSENYDIWVTLSGEEVNTFLSEFGFGVSCELEKAAGNSSDKTEEIKDLSREMVLSGEVPDGTYWVYARSISRSARCFDRYAMTGGLPDDEPVLVPAFSNDCVFYVNREMDSIRFEKIGFDEFADLVTDGTAWLNVPVRCVFRDGLITEASLMSSYLGQGISYQAISSNGFSWIEDVCRMKKDKTLDEILTEFYKLIRTEEADVSDVPGIERIEIYLGNVGDGDSGVVLIYDVDGNLLHIEDTFYAQTGCNNVYVGELDGTSYLMSMHIEDREDYGEYQYQVFRLGEAGELRQIAGSDFQWGESIHYDNGLFHQWADNLEYYLSGSHLLLTSQDGEMRTDAVSEADKYNYETLHR
ncbi:MAG: hypothetical protein HDQ95_06605 [Roseburia sp.]|nr:hypothetical protein [Roseburia sp.]